MQDEETFDGTWPFAARFTHAPGFRMHYVDEGPRSAPIILCLHGEPTWGYLFRHVIEGLRSAYRVVAPDHMGFGKSATPADRSYWLQDHVDNLERLVLDLDLSDITLVGHDFGGPTAMGLAARHPDRIARFVFVNGPAPFGQGDLAERVTANAAVSPWFQWILKAYTEGALEAVLGQLGYNALSTLKLNGFENNDVITSTWIRAYAAHFASPADCLGAIGWAKGFATGKHLFAIPTPDVLRAVVAKRAMTIWGEADRTLHAQHFLPLFQALWPTAPIHLLAGVGHYSLEDASEAIPRRIADFVAQW